MYYRVWTASGHFAAGVKSITAGRQTNDPTD